MCGGEPSDVHKTEEPPQKLWVLRQMREKADKEQTLEKQGDVFIMAMSPLHNGLSRTTPPPCPGRSCSHGPLFCSHIVLFIPPEGAELVQHRPERQGRVSGGIPNHPRPPQHPETEPFPDPECCQVRQFPSAGKAPGRSHLNPSQRWALRSVGPPPLTRPESRIHGALPGSMGCIFLLNLSLLLASFSISFFVYIVFPMT